MEYEKVDDLKRIKKDYGENMAHLCRSLFPTILESPGLLYHILSTHFAKSKSLYGDITSEHKEYLFKEYIYHFCDKEKENNEEVTKSVRELLDEAGYEIYECKTNADIEKFKKYYKKGEELCTFRDPYRIESHHIFFIVKKDVDKIKREDFKNPRREDAYGVSVLDLQFDKGYRQRVSIKSRYNHTVNNPDATYSNNLEMIAPGLTAAFEKDYDFNIGKQNIIGFELDNYVEARDGKFYKYNYEIHNIHYCPNNIILDNGYRIDTYADKSRYTFMDYFILDEQEKKIVLYDKRINDGFLDGITNITSIEINNKDGYKEVKLTMEGNRKAIIKLDSRGRIIGYINNYVEEIGDKFLLRNEVLEELQMDNLKSCGKEFLCVNYALEKLSLPSLEEVKDAFLYNNEGIKELYMPNLKKCGKFFLDCNEELKVVDLPSLEVCGNFFIWQNDVICEVNFPKLKECGDSFLKNAEKIRKLSLPRLEKTGDSFLTYNKKIKKIYLPRLEECGYDFLGRNDSLIELFVPNLRKCGNHFLGFDVKLMYLNAPKLEECGSGFLANAILLVKINVPNLKKYGNNFLMMKNVTSKIIRKKIDRRNKKYVDSEKEVKKMS